MQRKINILPETVMKRIAAGEVIERPASVAKELLENALDAGAGSISLMVKGAGSDLVQVMDNGSGMKEEDALICCERHATSKISCAEDLETINTMGFRGEALSSISSVSRMIITTSVKEDEEGTQVYLEEGAIREVLKVAANPGTKVAVKDLFFNVPVRRKFMKSPNTELRHIINVFRRIALAHHETEFSLFINEEKTDDLRTTTRVNRIKELLNDGSQFNFIPVDKNISGISISGFISAPGCGRKNRNNQFCFVNRRYIVNRSLIHSVLSAYGPRLGQGEYPAYFIFLEMEPGMFDVNVHPTKIEVRFSNERFIHDTLNSAIKDAMRSPAVVPELHLVTSEKRKLSSTWKTKMSAEDSGQLTLEAQRSLFCADEMNPISNEKERPSLWQIHNRYILAQIKSGLALIDQHVAHERILYERALESRKENAGLSQQLLFPQTVNLSPNDYLTLVETLPYLERIGFGIKEFGKNTVVVEAVPVEVRAGTEKELLVEIIEKFKEIRYNSIDTQDAVARSFACKSAVKSGDRLSLDEMASLVDQLFATKEPYFCPHGRPIIVNLSLEEIDKRFGR